MVIPRANQKHLLRVGGLLVSVPLVAACNDQRPVAPTADAVAAAPAGFIGDRPYTWSFTCHGGWVLFNQWSWTQDGVAIASGSGNCSGDETLNGTGVRPANANGFSAQVGTNSQTWTFDPAGPFTASLSGSMGGGGGHCFICLHKESGKLTVDS